MVESDTAYYAHDRVPLKTRFDGVRVVPGAIARWGSHFEPGVVLMPSYTNIAGYVGVAVVDGRWATVGSCAQIGRHVPLPGAVGVGSAGAGDTVPHRVGGARDRFAVRRVVQHRDDSRVRDSLVPGVGQGAQQGHPREPARVVRVEAGAVDDRAADEDAVGVEAAWADTLAPHLVVHDDVLGVLTLQVGRGLGGPVGGRGTVAVGTRRVTTAVRGDPQMAAVGAGLDVTAHRSGAAMFDR